MLNELEGIKVFVAEDRVPVAAALCGRLMGHGATVVGPAVDLAQATAVAQSTPFDVAILDVDLGGEFTYSLARSLRGRDIPVVLMTGYDSRTIPEDLLDLPLFDKLDPVTNLISLIAGLTSPT